MSHDDDLWMGRMRDIAAEVDPPPPSLDMVARMALSSRRLDGELADVMTDSALTRATLVRAADEGIRLLPFETSSLSVELRLEELNGRLSMRGLVTGASGGGRHRDDIRVHHGRDRRRGLVRGR